jgi:hypothetical protein
MARNQETIPPPDLEATRRLLAERRRRLDRIAQRYTQLEEALQTLESLSDECFPAPAAEPVDPGPGESIRPRQPR